MTESRRKPLRFLLQAFNYAVFMALIGYFASSPSIRLIADDEAVLTIAFAHAGQLREPCRRLTQAELNQLAPNMRKLEDCPRARSPVTIEALLDDELLFRQSLDPPGLFDDGGVDIYFSGKIPVGSHHLSIRMNDSLRVEGFNHVLEQSIRVSPAQVLLVGFRSGQGFVLEGGQG